MVGRDARDDYFVCPHCGAEVRRGARACPECGSDETTGWSEDADKWTAGIPTGYAEDDEFDYEEFARREFGVGRRAALLRLVLFLALAAALVVAAVVISL